jgi:hypothetical protein
MLSHGLVNFRFCNRNAAVLDFLGQLQLNRKLFEYRLEVHGGHFSAACTVHAYQEILVQRGKHQSPAIDFGHRVVG